MLSTPVASPDTVDAQTPFTSLVAKGHEQVVLCHDPKAGLKAIIAVHSTVLGPALGGTRMWAYANEWDALEDVLRLSRGMTHKAAAAGLNLGGGKAVIIGDASRDKSEALFRRFGKFVNTLGGRYITAEDVGTVVADMDFIKMETDHVVGLHEANGGGGDPSPLTARGVYVGIKATLKSQTGSEDLAGKKVLVQGVGKVGFYLVEMLSRDGATIYVSDINEGNINRVKDLPGVNVVPADDSIYNLDVDVYSPNALGGTLNPDTIPHLKCSVVAGGANNQLREEARDGDALRAKGILYAPDFVINAGGLINVAMERDGHYSLSRAQLEVDKIYDNLMNIYGLATTQDLTPQAAAIRYAEDRIVAIGNIKKHL